MATSKRAKSSTVQIIRTAPARVLVHSYLTKKGRDLADSGVTDENILAKYKKNRYADNPVSVPFVGTDGRVRTIFHEK